MINLRVSQLATIELLKSMIKEMHPDADDHWRQDFLMNLIDRVQQAPEHHSTKPDGATGKENSGENFFSRKTDP